MRHSSAGRPVQAILIFLLTLPGIAAATAQQDPNTAADPAAATVDPNTLWKDSAELGYVLTAGNSETNTFAFKNKLHRTWGVNAVEFNMGGLRSKATTRQFAVADDPNDLTGGYEVNEERNLVAEAYYLNGRYNRKFSERFFWYAGGGWDRNRFAGIQDRFIVAGGIGNVWFDTETLKWRTDYSFTYTDQEDVVDDPSFDGSFWGVRVTSSFLKKIGATTTYTNEAIFDDNGEETEDFRADMINSVQVQMSTHLALKVSLHWLYDNQPAGRSLDLYDIDPDNGGTTQGSVIEELDELDSIFTTSLVINI